VGNTSGLTRCCKYRTKLDHLLLFGCMVTPEAQSPI
jgi:hypothetical protein